MKTPRPATIPFLTILMVILCINAAALKAQEAGTCAEKLKSAESSFSRGQVDLIPGLLSECLKSGFTREEALTAYKLMIQTLLFNDKLKEADSSMLSFLKSNPEYRLSPTDHSSFINLYNNFVVKQVFMISIRTGINVPYLTFIKEKPTSGSPTSSTYKTNATNLFLSVEGKIKVTRNIEAGAGIAFSQVKFTNNISGFNNYARIQYTENQQRIEIPVGLGFDLPSFGKFTPYIRAGGGAALIMSAKADATLNMTDKLNAYSHTGGSMDVKDSRIPVDFFVQAGAGMKFKIPRGFLFIEARTHLGLLQQNRQNGSSSGDLDFYYFWSSPDFRLNTFNLNLGYTYIFYQPSKKQNI